MTGKWNKFLGSGRLSQDRLISGRMIELSSFRLQTLVLATGFVVGVLFMTGALQLAAGVYLSVTCRGQLQGYACLFPGGADPCRHVYLPAVFGGVAMLILTVGACAGSEGVARVQVALLVLLAVVQVVLGVYIQTTDDLSGGGPLSGRSLVEKCSRNNKPVFECLAHLENIHPLACRSATLHYKVMCPPKVSVEARRRRRRRDTPDTNNNNNGGIISALPTRRPADGLDSCRREAGKAMRTAHGPFLVATGPVVVCFAVFTAVNAIFLLGVVYGRGRERRRLASQEQTLSAICSEVIGGDDIVKTLTSLDQLHD